MKVLGAAIVLPDHPRLAPESRYDLFDGTEIEEALLLAYEVMRRYEGLILVDVSRQGGEPGTLYVMEVQEASIDAGIEDGEMLNPHAMDPQTVLRFVKTVAGWPGRVMVVACEPAIVEEMGIALSHAVAGAVDGAAAVVLETIAELRATPALETG